MSAVERAHRLQPRVRIVVGRIQQGARVDRGFHLAGHYRELLLEPFCLDRAAQLGDAAMIGARDAHLRDEQLGVAEIALSNISLRATGEPFRSRRRDAGVNLPQRVRIYAGAPEYFSQTHGLIELAACEVALDAGATDGVEATDTIERLLVGWILRQDLVIQFQRAIAAVPVQTG